MKDTYFEKFRSLDQSKLLTKDEVLAFLADHGDHEPSLAKLSDRYHDSFGIDPIWRYPLSDDLHNGAFIVPVREGFLWLPYDEVDKEYYEILLPDEASMLDAECSAYFAQQLRDYANDLCKILEIIHQSQEEGRS